MRIKEYEDPLSELSFFDEWEVKSVRELNYQDIPDRCIRFLPGGIWFIPLTEF